MAFLEQVDAWLRHQGTRVYAILDNLRMHRAANVLLLAVMHLRWAVVFQPNYAACLNQIEP